MREDELEFIIQALRSIEAGATADSLESEILDFKEDPAVHPRNRNPDASLVEFLIDEAVCFSNADNGNAFIVLGVADKKSGPEAFTGTQRELDWLIRKIFEGTQPNIHIEAEELEWCGARLIVLRVPRGITLYQRQRDRRASELTLAAYHSPSINAAHSSLNAPTRITLLTPPGEGLRNSI
ncbi:helix-turn-helix domain-containing protein [Corynebacterium sp. HMSC05D03]|uniref:AlbA family DNA-binding domain-containing protein n=1 Tax=Corynebacterium sp. HMSC05D03 TaxID=1581115 RepID=UPI0008B8E6D6|nr:ATP-binding protein [Corynebacterium sp. HMSC05D03]OFT66926.1 hypothetical protein HMPREF3147_03395 [Corynebacterium sp. HMSC05D03]